MVRLRHLPGDRVPGGLVVDGVLGSGSFGTVYRCLAPDGSSRAVKEMHVFNDPLAASQALEFFRREADVLTHLNHPAVPRAEAIDLEGPWPIDPATGLESDGGTCVMVASRHYLIMEYVPGPTLESLVREAKSQGQQLLAEQVFAWGRQIGRTLAYLHSQGLVHRDVKPHNIIIRDGDQAAVLIDYGLCKPACEPGGYETAPMSSSGRFGTRGYAPPDPVEQESPTPASDQHALGMTIRRALTGLDPSDERELAILREHRLVELRPTVPPYQAAACDRAIRQAPEDRCPSIEAFLHALDAAPVGTPPPTRYVELTPAELVVGPVARGQLRDLALRISDRRAGTRVMGHAKTDNDELRILPAHEQGSDVVLHLMLRVKRTAALGPAKAKLTVHANDEQHDVAVLYEVVEAPPSGCGFPFG